MNIQNDNAEAYWIDYLQEAKELNFPAFIDDVPSGFIRSVEVEVGKENMRLIRESASQKDLNVLKLFMGAFGIVLSRYTQQSDVLVAMPPMKLAGIDIARCGTLYCRLTAENNLPVAEYFNRLHESVNDAYLNCEYNEPVFLENYTHHSKNSRIALEGAAFNYHNLHEQGAWLKDHRLIFELIEGDAAVIRVRSIFSFLPEQLLINMAESLLYVVLHLPEIKAGHIKDCQIFPSEQSIAWVRQFEKNTRSYAENITVVDLFLQQATRHPDKSAIIDGPITLTYYQLEELSGRISGFITRLPEPKGPLIIGVMVERSHMLVAAVLGILRAGAAYVPIDRDYPEERIRDILQDTGCPVVFTSGDDPTYCIEGCEFVSIDRVPGLPKSGFPAANGLPISGSPAANALPKSGFPAPGDLAYIIYSSGTTGKPKGIMIEHAAILNLLFWYNERYAINENTRIVQLTNITIDIAFQEIFSSLINGLTLYIPSEEERHNKERFIDFLTRHRINFIQLIPDLLSEYLADIPRLTFLDTVLCGGDKLSDPLKDEVTKKGYTLYNIYGQTETAVDTVAALCSFGKPMHFNEFVPNYHVLILDEQGHLCPEFMPGEIVTGGRGLARGYLNQPALTAQKFIEHPLLKGQKAYKTGDMARRLPDGSIELLGRTDDQVKILGYRIEPGEIEKALESHPNLQKAVVIAFEKDNEKQLAAYYTANTEVETKEIRGFLLQRLPAYMIPHHFIRLEKLPLTSIGKVDRKALSNPVVEKAKNYRGATGAISEKLVEIWSEVLKLSPSVISIDSNFFELGGQSLKVIRVLTAIEKEFNVKIHLTTFFTKPTIAELEECILMDSLSKKGTTTAKKITI